MVDRDISLAKYTNGNLHLSYISTEESVNKIKKAKKEGCKITCDVSINNLVLSEEKLINFDTSYKLLPPLRTKKDNSALLKGLKNKTIDVICSDHSPENIENKKIEFDNAAFGIIGLETLFGLLGKYLSDQLNLEEIIEKISSNPRKIVLKETPKIEEGEKANITLFNPQLEWEFNKKDIKSKSINTHLLEKNLKESTTIYNNNQFLLLINKVNSFFYQNAYQVVIYLSYMGVTPQKYDRPI